ncbi:type II secretion system F family protein [Patescibacteria group bacterium]|nr:type II secretion system F family protein [Patescibacteria group bacterium]MBU1890103.1 type II secretion system F family protein [Patescibacteria group bacterium]
MSDFLYTAQALDGSIKKDKLEAANKKELESKLNKDGLSLVSSTLVQKQKNQKVTGLEKFLNRVSLVDRMFFTQNLEVMIRTGFSIARALKTLSLQASNPYFAKIINQICSEVEQGKTLATSMREYPNVFSSIFINMIEAGEVSGQLESVLKRLTIQMKKDHALIAKVKGALTYPAVILIAMAGVGVAMFIFVIPKITSLYDESTVELPMATKLLISTSDFASKNAILVVGSMIALVIIVMRWLKTKHGRRVWHTILLRLPIFSKIVKKINLARFTRTLSSLLKTDIPIVKAFTIISNTLGNVYYRDAMMVVADNVKQGNTITSVLEQYPALFPPVVTQIINVGEQSGTIDTISEEIAVFYEEEVEQTMSSLATIIEPILMLVLGAGVGLVAIAIIMPMYNLVETI